MIIPLNVRFESGINHVILETLKVVDDIKSKKRVDYKQTPKLIFMYKVSFLLDVN